MNSRKTKFSILLLLSLFGSIILTAQPAGYYDSASGLTGTALQQAIHDIIKNHTSRTYDNLWTDFQVTDRKANGKVWDMYSDLPSGTPVYEFIFITNQCGNYAKEGDCYNREHSFPKSWFGGEKYPMYSDLFHLYPTDGWVNNKRGNSPFGITSSPTWTSTNGSKVGPSSYTGYSEDIFEPINEYKGDFARSYFYMAVRYYGEDSSWTGSDMVDGSQLKPWALKMLMEWDIADPISTKETDRNNAVYSIQGNRNPFIDNPAYAALIWGTQSGTEDVAKLKERIRLWPNPVKDLVNVELPERFPGQYKVSIADATGRIIYEKSVSGKPVTLDLSNMRDGLYIMIITDDTDVITTKLVIGH
ncbi:MAG: endonuclease [Bacteroidales bacterium]|jgi:endonuclease I|nr:endonuclease [Bacteroidales bacterium]